MQPATSALEVRARAARSRTLSSWRLVRLLGQGEWNEVYQASPLDATVSASADYAIKLLKASCEGDCQAIVQLQHEAFVGKMVSHPHLETVLSAHVDRAPHYLVMPYQPGASLRELLLQSQRLGLAQSLWIARQAAEGLHALHEQGWIHRDVKPDNIYIAANGHVTVCDLGLASRIDHSPLAENLSLLAGTPAYMPPESFGDATSLTVASDTYSLGVTLFETLTGSLPFTQRDPAELAAAHRLLKSPDPRSLQPDIPSAVVRLLRRMLAKEPLRRPEGVELIDWLVDLEIDSFEERN